MDDLSVAIFRYLESNPRSKALNIARSLGVSRKEINRVLYANHGQKLVRDENYRWSISCKESDLSTMPIYPKSFGSGSFRGYSFFRVVSEGEKISVVFNRSHPLLNALDNGMIDGQRELLEIVVGSFADALVELYDFDQDLEDVIDFWGRYLASSVKAMDG